MILPFFFENAVYGMEFKKVVGRASLWAMKVLGRKSLLFISFSIWGGSRQWLIVCSSDELRQLWLSNLHVELSLRICTDLWAFFPWESVKIVPLLPKDNCRSARIFKDVQGFSVQIFRETFFLQSLFSGSDDTHCCVRGCGVPAHVHHFFSRLGCGFFGCYFNGKAVKVSVFFSVESVRLVL